MPALTPKTEEAMFHEIMEELRHVRRRLDAHIDADGNTLKALERDVAKIREDMSAHKTKLSIIAGTIAFAVTTAVSWILGDFK